MMTFSAPSCATSHVPTIGSNVVGGFPISSLLRSTLVSAPALHVSKATAHTNGFIGFSSARQSQGQVPEPARRHRRSPPHAVPPSAADVLETQRIPPRRAG